MDNYAIAVQEQNRTNILTELTMYTKRGIIVTIEGYHFPVEVVADLISVCEGYCYMPDFLRNDDGNLCEVRFQRIKLD